MDLADDFRENNQQFKDYKRNENYYICIFIPNIRWKTITKFLGGIGVWCTLLL